MVPWPAAPLPWPVRICPWGPPPRPGWPLSRLLALAAWGTPRLAGASAQPQRGLRCKAWKMVAVMVEVAVTRAERLANLFARPDAHAR